MNPELLLRATALALLLRLSSSTPDHPNPESCEPKSCGNGVNISYPFWINGQHPSYCGFPQFRVNCSAKTPFGPILSMVYNRYLVRGIFYNNQSLLVSVTQINEPTSCPLPYYNLSFSLTPFAISAFNKGLYLLRHCEGFPLGSYEVGCDKGGTFAYIGDGYWSPEHPGSSNKCGNTTVVPVMGGSSAKGSDYRELLESGFLLEWSAANCTECRASKGQCGYDEKGQRFMCICHDRIHAAHCRKNRKLKLIVIGAGIGAAMLATLCLICFFCFWFKLKTKRQNSISNCLIKSTPSDPSSLKDAEFGSTNYLTQIFSYKELHEATDGFDANQELGDGGFGTVYKGKLQDGRVVAVKRLYENNFKRVEQFMNEVEILSPLRHPNLVTLYGCTSRHSRELLLVYEFVPNGTVADHIHGPQASHGSLTWPLRLNIAIESADALAYLHAIEPQIIHRDVKTNNILLDNSFHVKVADFGLSRLFPVDATHVSTLPQGTPGYVDPEYHQCYQLTDKSDVYSFGVVLIELISSKPAVDIGRHRHEINLANLAINKIQNRKLEELIDPGLGYRSDPEMEMMINMVAELAFRCLQGEKEMRPPIKEVLEELRRIQSWGYNKDKESEADFQTTEDLRLLKNIPPCSPNSVTLRWESRSTTPNTST